MEAFRQRPLKRQGSPREIADVAGLASDRITYVTAQRCMSMGAGC